MNTLHNLPVLECKPGFLIGADPELAIFNPDGRVVAAEGIIPGTKAAPYKVDGGAVQVDGVAAEFNVDPSGSFEEFNDNIIKVIGALQSMLPAGHTLRAVPTVEFTEEDWERVPEKAKVLGCSPDFNAWTASVNPAPRNPDRPRMRCMGGHLHIGWRENGPKDFQHLVNCNDLVKQLDWYLGAWSINHDSDHVRRTLYGRAGSCRYKSYGVEYRVLSNFWVLDERMRLIVWNRLQRAISDMKSCSFPTILPASVSQDIVNAINESKLRNYLKRDYRSPLVEIDGVDTEVQEDVNITQRVIMNKAMQMKASKPKSTELY